MIEILPMEDREREKELLSAIEKAGDKARVLAMTERGVMLGYAVVEVRGEKLLIWKLAAGDNALSQKPQGEEIFIFDTLMRSAASFGETFGARQIETAFPDTFGFFKARGFASDEDHAFTPMETIVKYE